MRAVRKKVAGGQVKKAISCPHIFQLEDIAGSQEFYFLRGVWYSCLVESLPAPVARSKMKRI
jgi:hypothetical protein